MDHRGVNIVKLDEMAPAVGTKLLYCTDKKITWLVQKSKEKSPGRLALRRQAFFRGLRDKMA